MKLTTLILPLLIGSTFALNAQTNSDDVDQLIGHWQIDLTPNNNSDENFAEMTINHIDGNAFSGEFYRPGVGIKKGRINQNKGVYGALMSADNSGQYATSFQLKNGKLYGTTHALDRGFLSVWEATKHKK